MNLETEIGLIELWFSWEDGAVRQAVGVVRGVFTLAKINGTPVACPNSTRPLDEDDLACYLDRNRESINRAYFREEQFINELHQLGNAVLRGIDVRDLTPDTAEWIARATCVFCKQHEEKGTYVPREIELPKAFLYAYYRTARVPSVEQVKTLRYARAKGQATGAARSGLDPNAVERAWLQSERRRENENSKLPEERRQDRPAVPREGVEPAILEVAEAVGRRILSLPPKKGKKR